MLSSQHFQQNRMPEGVFDLSYLAGQTYFVDAAHLIEQDSSLFAGYGDLWTATQWLPLLVRGATITLGRAAFISSGEITSA